MGGELHEEGRDIHEDGIIPPLDTSFRYTAEEDATLIMESLFHVDLLPVVEGANQVTVRNILDEQMQFVVKPDSFNELVAERGEGAVFTLALIDLGALKSTFAALAKTIRSESYIDGRIDQLADLIGTSKERAVKARDLGKVYDDAGFLRDDRVLTKTEFLANSKELRGMLQIVPDKNGPDEKRVVFRRKIDDGENA